MKLRYCSDIHLEFDTNRIVKPSQIIGDSPEEEILLIAGDLVPTVYLKEHRNDAQSRSIKRATEFFVGEVLDNYKAVYLIPGNHCSYGGDINETVEDFNLFLEDLGVSPNYMRMVQNETIPLMKGFVLLHCTTLWTDMHNNDPLAHEAVGGGLNDYRLIRNGDRKLTTRDTYELHQRSLEFLEQAYDPERQNIIMAHHAPSFMSIRDSDRHGGLCDYGYFSELSDFILNRPKITHFIHGHTHHNLQYDIGPTKVLVNCRGYGMQFYGDRCFRDFSVRDAVIEC